jgi:hypothetical protein
MIIRRIDPISAAKIYAVICACIGLIFGVLFALVGSSLTGGMFGGGGFGITTIIVMPIVYGLFGFIVVAIAAAIYNVVAGAVGGVRIDVE